MKVMLDVMREIEKYQEAGVHQRSMSQNPFQPGQRERTPQEQADFLKAINALPEIFFTADAVLHIDGDWPELEVEHLHEMLKEEDLSKFQLRENGTAVLAYNQFQADDGSLAQLPVYTVESVDGGRQARADGNDRAVALNFLSLFWFKPAL
ncbi:hypothetical protein AK812_SmicGene4542 [Symbiodinium microadriaticum]|uniref:Uncharacterized protein n=1 Tax=Symbiodinium microadriaticum TaxID=2951 RepID=A0A1Q9EW29_SYMMI|nr:hypothetical protein AK812_SmicGene4542 [Symbiodinium microadriaticum]